MAQNADLDIVLSTLHISADDSIRPSFANFTLPYPRHGCAGGTRVRTCPTCAGSGASRSGTKGKTLLQCPTCTGKGFQTSACGICLESLASAHEYRRQQLEVVDCEERGGGGCAGATCTAGTGTASTSREKTNDAIGCASRTEGQLSSGSDESHTSGGDEDAALADSDEAKDKAGADGVDGGGNADGEAEERADTPVR